MPTKKKTVKAAATTAPKKPEKKAGRPRGAKTKPVDQVRMKRTECQQCGSTKRTPYTNIRRAEIEGELVDGRKYSAVVWRRTTCKECGQARDDKEFVPPQKR